MTRATTRFRSRAGNAAAAAGLLLLLCVSARAASPYRYEVSVDPSLERLAVHACFDGKAPDALVAGSDGARLYLESMRLVGPANPSQSTRHDERPLVPEADRVSLEAAPENACVDYRVALRPAQTLAQTGGPETRRVGNDMLTSIGDWFWRPQDSGTAIELRFKLPAGTEISAPWQRETGGDGRPVFVTGITPHTWQGVVAFGRFVPRDVQVPGAILHLAMLGAPAPGQQAQLEKWIDDTARNVALLYGRFPVASLQVVVTPTPRGRGPVPWAYVSRGGGPAVHLFINPARPPGEFERDWSLTHEMSHLFLPYVVSRDAWLFEGVPTYLQNILMARGGATSVEEAWQRMDAGFQRGARTAPDLSLARASERIGYNGIYMRVYWAGAAMMLDADLQLRNQSGGRQSLDTALEQLSRCCASEDRRWSGREIIDRLDELTATTIFGDLVRAQFDGRGGFPGYEVVLARAGVKVEGTRVEFDASAPWAAERDALMLPPR